MIYPFTFEPLLKEVIWGGSDICPFKGITPVKQAIGESWEISNVEGNDSLVANGSLKGQSLSKLIEDYGENLVGEKVMNRFGTTFPLLIKFIDAQKDLSIQVHPDDKLAAKRHHSFGKTEMWYVINATGDAALYSGFSKAIDADDYVKRIQNNTFMETLNRFKVNKGDVFFIPAGRVHAIGAGCFVAEIQQTSNITYRIYDYDRRDAAGNARELHTELAKDAINYTLEDNYKTSYTPEANKPVNIASCPYFNTNLLDIDQQVIRNHTELDSFVIYICMEGNLTLTDDNDFNVTLRKGQTVLVPALNKKVKLTPSTKAKLLETYIV